MKRYFPQTNQLGYYKLQTIARTNYTVSSYQTFHLHCRDEITIELYIISALTKLVHFYHNNLNFLIVTLFAVHLKNVFKYDCLQNKREAVKIVKVNENI